MKGRLFDEYFEWKSPLITGSDRPVEEEFSGQDYIQQSTLGVCDRI